MVDTLGDEPRPPGLLRQVGETSTHALLLSFGVVFVAELGDKTMLATITLATTEGAFGTWLGSRLGMVAADALAIVVGKQLGTHLPARVIKYGAAAAFVVFGVILIGEGAGW